MRIRWWMHLLQWVVYLVGAIAVLVAGVCVLGMLIVALLGLSGAGLLLAMAATAGFGAIWGVLSITVWVLLAERGWFV